MNSHKIFKIIIIIGISFFFLNSCGAGKKLKDLRKPVDLRNSPINPDERAKKNIEEGKGISLKGITGNKSTNYEFSTCNPMWRASLETLDFIPLSTVDYSGGMIITDWYSEGTRADQESLKITVRFLSNEIRSESLKVVIHQKKCSTNQACKINLVSNSILIDELQSSILRKAAQIDAEQRKKKK